MPQQTNDPWADTSNWEVVNPNQNDPWADTSKWEVVTPKPKKEPTWTQSAISHGLAITPQVLGGIAGSFVEPGLGTLAGSSAGATLGDYLQQQYDISQGLQDKYNPARTMIAAGIGAIPILGEVPGEGATAAELGKYALRAPFSHAAQGAVIGGGATIPQSLADTGKLPSWEQMGKGALGGGAAGFVGGAAFGTVPSFFRAKGMHDDWINWRNSQEQPSTPTPEFQRRLEGRVEPIDAEVVNDVPPSQPPPPKYASPGMPPPEGVGHRIIRDDWTPAMMEHYKQMGYVPGGIDPVSGNAYMEFRGSQQSTQQAPSQEQPSNPFDQVPVEEDSTGETVRLNKPSNTAIENLKAEGFKLVEIDRSGMATFKRLFTDESGQVDFGALKAGLRRMLGREPTEEEVQRKAFEENSHISVEPGIQTGRVAPFKPPVQEPPPQEPVINQVMPPGMTDQIHPRMPSRVMRLNDPMQVAEQLQHWTRIADQTTDPVQLGIMHATIEAAKTRLEELQQQPGPQPVPSRQPEVLPVEPKLDIFGYPADRDLTPEEVSRIKNQILQEERQYHGPDDIENQATEDRMTGTIDTMSKETEGIVNEIMQAGNEGFAVLPPGYRGSMRNLPIIRTLSDGSHVVDPTQRSVQVDPNINVTNPIDQLRGQNQLQNIGQQGPINEPVDLGPQPNLQDFEPQEMRTPGRAFKSDPNRMDLGPRYYGQGRPSIAGDLVQARDSQNERARALGIDPKGMSDDELVNAIRRARGLTDEEPQEMRVPGVREGNTGLENVAMGGANERTLDVMGSSLYSRSRPVTTVKELLQNAFDEHKEMGITEPIRVLIDSDAKNPMGGDNGKSITVRDRGRGLNPDQIYSVLTNIGETGKAGVESASGGFGFAKAAPFLGGKYAKVTSVIDTPQGRIRYTFEGRPSSLKNQTKGVPINAELVGNDVPTGLEMTTFYDNNMSGFYNASSWAKNMVERSPSVESPVLIADTYNANPKESRRWLDESPSNPIRPNEYNYLAQYQAKEHKSQPITPLVDSVTIPGSKIDFHYEIIPGLETGQADLHLMNKGMYQGSNQYSYGDQVSNVPSDILANIIATVEEGHEDYPFSANREQVNDEVNKAIKKWVSENIISGIAKKRVAEIQKKYDGIAPLHPHGRQTNLSYLDDGNLLTKKELKQITSNPTMVKALQKLEDVHDHILSIVDSLGWTPESYSATWRLPSERLKKFGLLFQAPDAKGTVLGIHIPRPDDMNNSAILINLMEHLNDAIIHSTPIDRLSTMLLTTLAHEDAHIPGGTHDKNFAYRDADLRSKLGQSNTVKMLDDLARVFDDGNGNISSEISDLLSIYNESRKRATGSPNALLATGINIRRPTNTPGGTSGNVGGFTTGGNQSGTPTSKLKEAYNLSRGITTTMDLSAPLRQGLPLIGTRAWWTSWNQQMRALGSEEAYNKTIADIKARPMFRRYRDSRTGKEIKSFAEQAGLALTDVSTNLNQREESIASSWTESGKMFGENNAVQRGYKKTIGRGARASNRAYTAYLNQLRADTFETLIKDAKVSFDSSQAAGTLAKTGDKDPLTDMTYAREIAQAVNTLTGRGSLTIVGPSMEGGKLHLKEHSAEAAAGILTNVMFAPRNTAAKMQMMNPMTYMMASPFVRHQYVMGLLGVAGAWLTVSGLASLAGADVTLDPRSADFGKVKIGNFRLDPGGGFQQFLVDYARNATGHTLSSASGKNFELGQGYRAPTRKDINEGFWVNKLHPLIKFAYDISNASQHQPFGVMDRTLQQVVPLVVQDLWDIVKENPELLPFAPAIIAGMGTQIYNKGQTEERFIPKEYDYNFTGGELPGSSLFTGQ